MQPMKARTIWQIVMSLVLITGFFAPLHGPSTASPLADPTSVTLVGSLQSELGCAGDWDPACAASHLDYDANDAIWQKSWTVPAGSYEYKVTLNDTWDENYGRFANRGGGNLGLAPAADTNIKFYYDPTTHWVADNRTYTIASVPGDFQSELGCSGDWDPGCLRSWLQDPDENGIYTFTTTALPAGNYQGKAAINESWDLNYGQGGVQNGPNIEFSVPTDNAVMIFAYNAATHVLTVTPGPTTVTLVGSLQNELGCGGDWDPSCAATHLTYDPIDDVWQGTWTVPAGNHEYKVALNGSWDENYGKNATPGGANIALNLTEEKQVKFYYDHKSHWITDKHNVAIATVPGNYQRFLGCNGVGNGDGNWDPGCLRSWLQDPDGDGIYTFETKLIPAGDYEGKVAINESWDENYGQGGAPGGANIPFSVPSDGATVIFRYNAATHLLSISAGHGADNNVEYFGLGHNSQDTLYRVPFGAINPGTELTLRFRTYHNDATKVRVRFWDTASNSEFFKNMELAASDVSCYDEAQPKESCDFWQLTYTPTDITTLYYRFVVADGTATAYYADDNYKDGGWGVATPNIIDNSYVVTVFDPDFQPVPWMKDAVVYQIFPDRFRNGQPKNDPKSSEPRYGYPDNPDDQIILKKWGDLPEGYCRGYESPAEPCAESPRGRDYYGGDLTGLRHKLNYLQSLGVKVIYLNPIFEAGSNHLYDTQDYYKIDHFFGSNEEFQALAKLAHNRGMKIIIDGVFNHVSSDSPYFDRYGHYTEVGACESLDSPYRDWFTFRNVTPGTGPCVGENGPASTTYESWWGFDSLPVLNKHNQEVKDLIYATENSVARYWMRMGADGWRLDVMPDPSFPAGFWQEFRAAVLDEKPEAIILGELWKKADVLPLVHGDQADSTMNYRFRNAIQGFLGKIDDKGFPDDGQSDQPPSLFARKMMAVREDYPDGAYYTLMNLMDSHDTERILWSLTPGKNNREEKEFNAENLALGIQRLELAAVIQMTVPGAPTIYYGDEIGLNGDDDPDDRRTFPWTDMNPWAAFSPAPYYGAGGDHDLFDHYRKLTTLRNNRPVFRDGNISFLLTDDANRTLAYLVRTETDGALVAINRNSEPQTLVVNVKDLLPAAVVMNDALGGLGDVTAVDGVLTFDLPGLGAAVLLPVDGQDLVAPAAPLDLVAEAGNGLVDLAWEAAGDAAAYNVYRSPLTGGGYVLVGSTEEATFTDLTVTNGRRYYYVVKAVDAAGNLGAASNQASALPAFPIGWAGLQWPHTIDHVLSVNNTENIYGQVWVEGVTDSGGDPKTILAEVGFGPQGSDPAGWTDWTRMAHNASCGGCGNNYEYMGSLRPEQTGAFDYLVRFSTNGGETWTYGYWSDGTPGALTVTPNADTEAPAAPTNLHVVDWSAGFIALAWDEVADAAEYWVYRSTTAGDYGQPLVKLVAPAGEYKDEELDPGVTYYYVVKVVDAALNQSAASNEVFQKAEPKMVNVTFRVLAPAETPAGDSVHIVGGTLPLEWNPGKEPMTKVGENLWEITLQFLDGTNLEYKYTRGVSWDRVEWWGTIVSVANRHVTISYGTDGTQLVDNTATTWGDGPDDEKAVQFWRDPLVTATTPIDGWSGTAPANVSVAFARAIQPLQGQDFSSSVTVQANGVNVSGAVTAPDNTTLVWTPNAALSAGTYTVTVFNVRSDLGGDSVPMQAPYIFTFTVNAPLGHGYGSGFRLSLPIVLQPRR